MKKIFTLLAAVLMTANILAQAPQKMSYQAVIRNSSNALVASTQVGMKISILQATSTGTAVYIETQTPTTNANGLVSLAIGSGSVVSGTFSAIDWSAGPYFIKTETDPTGGTSYSITGISQLMSVPFALYAANSGSAGVPYTGATASVDLGAHDLTVNGLTIGKGLGNRSNNTAIGQNTLSSDVSGFSNTANGFEALKLNTSGNFNTAIGASSLTSNTTGGQNTSVGIESMLSNTTGNGNVAIGRQALVSNTEGNYNAGLGIDAIAGNTTGSFGVGIGKGALGTNTTGRFNTAVGPNADVASGDLRNATAIGNSAIVAASNTIQLGNADVTNVNTSGSITSGAVTYPNTDGTSGQVLSTNGSGTVSWSTPAASSSQITDLIAQVTQLQAQIASLNFGAGLFSKVTIGTKTWSTTNLDVTTYRDGSAIPQVTDPTEWSNLTTGAWCYVENDSLNNTPYGKLYNWYAVNDPRGIAPIGYHVSTESDFLDMIDATGGDQVSGFKLKEVGYTHWNSGDYREGSTNSSGFTAVGSGCRYSDGTFHQFNRLAVYQLSDVHTEDNIHYYPRYKVIRADDGVVFTDWIGFSPNNGFSIRLVKD